MSRQFDPPPSFTVNPQTPLRTVRHRSSLEHVFNFTLASPQPSRAERDEAHFLYHELLHDCESTGLTLRVTSGFSEREQIHVHNVFRALIEFCPHDAGRHNLVRMILHGLFCTTQADRSLRGILPAVRRWPTMPHDARDPVFRALQTIAADFVLGFFVPLTAQACCTPSVSGMLSPPTRVASTQGTPHRLRGLRRTCLLRDGNRCVVSGHLDKEVHRRDPAEKRSGSFGVQTQAAHIIPHALNAVRTLGDALLPAKNFVWQILNMFDPGVSDELEGVRIDSPANAMILATELHDEFGKLRCYLEEVAPNEYVFRRTRDAAVLSPAANPKSRIVFRNHEPEGVVCADLPSPRLLKLHAACCKMMDLAGAAEYVEYLIDDLERLEVRGTLAENGSSDVGVLLRMKGLWGWDGEEVEREDISTVATRETVNVL